MYTKPIKEIKKEMRQRESAAMWAALSRFLSCFRMTNEGATSVFLATGFVAANATFV